MQGQWLIVFLGCLQCASAAPCSEGAEDCKDLNLKTSIMQMNRPVAKKRRITTSAHDELFGMLKAVKAQIGETLYSEVTPEVDAAIQQMIALCETIFGEIKSDHDAANQQLETEANALYGQYVTSEGHFGTTLTKDSELEGCRTTEKADLYAWEQCMADFHLCSENCIKDCEEAEGNRYFNYNLHDHYGVEDITYTCVFLSMQATGEDAPESCQAYSSVTAKYAQLEEDFEEALAGYTEDSAKCVTTCDSCAQQRETCGQLRVDYYSTHEDCTADCTDFDTHGCQFGESYQNKCELWDVIEATVASVNYATGTTGPEEGGTLSHFDRYAEYTAVADIKCLLESYQTGGTFDDDAVCERLSFEARIGTMDYQTTKREESVAVHGCANDQYDVEFRGFWYDIGKYSTMYVDNTWVPTVTLRDASLDPFPFCTETKCQIIEQCGSTHSLDVFLSTTGMVSKGFTFGMSGDSTFEHIYDAAGYYRGWDGTGEGTVSLTLMGQGTVKVGFANGASEGADVSLLLNTVAVATAPASGGQTVIQHTVDFVDGDVLELHEQDGIIILGYLDFRCGPSEGVNGISGVSDVPVSDVPATTSVDTADCPEHYTAIGQKCFRAHVQSVPAVTGSFSAQETCWQEGGNLASIHDAAEQEKVKTLLLKAVSEQGRDSEDLEFLVGFFHFHDHPSIDDMQRCVDCPVQQWADGTAYTGYNNFVAGMETHAENIDNHYWQVAALSSAHDYQWVAKASHATFDGFLCDNEEGLPRLANPICESENGETWDLLNGRSQKCYLWVLQKLGSWEASNNYCKDLGGQLATINNIEEQAKVDEMREAVLDQISDDGFVYVGFYNLGPQQQESDYEDYYWIDGLPPLMRHWGSGEPNNFNGNLEKCGNIRRKDGMWNDDSCTKSITFVCSKLPVEAP